MRNRSAKGFCNNWKTVILKTEMLPYKRNKAPGGTLLQEYHQALDGDSDSASSHHRVSDYFPITTWHDGFHSVPHCTETEDRMEAIQTGTEEEPVTRRAKSYSSGLSSLKAALQAICCCAQSIEPLFSLYNIGKELSQERAGGEAKRHLVKEASRIFIWQNMRIWGLNDN